ncbi:hypothetical protein [Streptomyces sp. JJ38]|uniref:hypothetical protein n=1 Tax=Streptomyces sp. JJ38 TaxID=2738128 RepID=UPI001C58A064|nr:hypothetical protein [Streptomyces sp. JJ38]MBW1597763.1 hypothetical protein [Streptomyces sp. JJ38]
MRPIRKTALGAASLAVAVVLTGCSGGGEKSDEGGTSAPAKSAEQRTEERSALQVMTAATKKTTEAKSARVEMTMTMPEGAAGPGGEAGSMEMRGVMSWDPVAMDLTLSGSAFEEAAGEPGMPDEIRMIWLDDVMYMHMGEAMAAETDGKSWIKMDLGALAEQTEDEEIARQMTGGLQDMGQSPAEQMALLLDSPSIKHVGAEKLDGEATQHYQGTLSIAELLEMEKEQSASADFMTEEERKELLEGMDETGIESLDLDVWINGDDMPVKLTMTMDSPMGAMEVTQRITDYGVKVAPQAPPAKDTFDFMQMLEEMGEPGSPAV